ncbi:MAG: radical SAM protein [Syntrophobacterales bacterium]|jgi:spore coat polysaccharide biosynthesis protein SpsF (cytidylyltransferase family)/MoaA/NifB/PqqE/SkfB family radical SAM enzyme|nr:radical SAM protein [Syntrophobacterales bacterium]
MPNLQIPIIIQATNRSSLFASKVLACLTDDLTVLAYLVKRLQSLGLGPILLATSNEIQDDSLASVAQRTGIAIYRGHQDNLISRLSAAARQLECSHFVRVYGSYPLTDLRSLAELAETHLARGMEYSYNEHRFGVPWGLGCEVISQQTLEKLANFDLTSEQKEAGTLFIRQNPHLFSIHRSDATVTRPNLKLALETEQDLRLLRDIVHHLPDPDLPSIIDYLDAHPILANSNQQETPPQEIGLEKLFLHPAKMQALLDSQAEGVDRTYPISVELSLTNRCNLKCIWCSDADLRYRQGINSDLDDKTLFALFDDLKEGGTGGVVLEGGGEPTLHRHFRPVVEKLSEVGLGAGLITNGLTPLPADVLKAMQWVRISLDASTPEEFQALKGYDGFEKVLHHIYQFAASCPMVGVGYVVTNRNLYDLETLVLRLRRYGVSYIQFRPVVDCPDLASGHQDLVYLKRYQTASFSVFVDGMHENAVAGNDGLPCRAHSLTTVISGDGSVFLCGRLNIHPWLRPLGNIREQSFRDIWLGSERRRQALQVGDSRFCETHCPTCRLAKFNKLLARLKRTKSSHFI